MKTFKFCLIAILSVIMALSTSAQKYDRVIEVKLDKETLKTKQTTVTHKDGNIVVTPETITVDNTVFIICNETREEVKNGYKFITVELHRRGKTNNHTVIDCVLSYKVDKQQNSDNQLYAIEFWKNSTSCTYYILN